MKQSVKERIIETALDLFQQKGYHGVTIDEIVEKAKTSKGGFYHNFKSKDSLLYEIHDIFISHVLAETKQVYESYDSPILRLYNMLVSFTHVFDVYNRHITVFYDESAYLQDEYKDTIYQKRKEYRKLIERVIDDGKESKHFRSEISTSITTMAIIGLVNWTYKWYKSEGPLSMEEITAYFNDIVLRGIVTEVGLNEAKELQLIRLGENN
ncbi:TetR/AcrR family transcriptional regulator [Ureibacillus manganicus]|uniref:TetR family transcriptional regulator n=1 Tax=Ureibacillus manganicus DSM 26584 TaxID=1384049 RepID=A0A0A3HWA5_9BACL|nr:TetR/AcrR family transcriptional regulator [Ureibacillus manganicus]KGR76714.1 TetR family transcriptional regulator [Ureibacillus manganicus DSM 26584]